MEPQTNRVKVPASRPKRRRTADEIDATVLQILAEENFPLSAHSIALRSATTSRAIVPAQVYRTLGRLEEEGTVSRIESLSAYAIKPESGDVPLIDKASRKLEWASAPEIACRLKQIAEKTGFRPRRLVIEIQGRFKVEN